MGGVLREQGVSAFPTPAGAAHAESHSQERPELVQGGAAQEALSSSQMLSHHVASAAQHCRAKGPLSIAAARRLLGQC